MCGRFTLRTPAAQMLEIFNLVEMPALAPRYNIAPTQLVICIRSVAEDPKSREAVQMKWGLIPFWAKDIAIGNQMINARAETVAVQASPEWSAAHLEVTADIAARDLLDAFGSVVGVHLPPQQYVAAHRWRYGQCSEPDGRSKLFDPEIGLAVCGDWLADGRVEGAFLAGIRAADAVCEH